MTYLPNTLRLKKKLLVREPWIHVFIWICILTLPLGMALSTFGKIDEGMLLRLVYPPVLFYVNYSILSPKLLLKKKFFLYALFSILFLVMFNLLVKWLPSSSPFDRMSDMVGIGKDSPFRHLQYAMITAVSLAFFLLGGTLRLIKDFYERDKIQAESEAQRAETELEFLKAQLNPHFLFNSLNSVYSLVRNKSDDASEAVITLSELMRYMLYEANQNEVSLEKEIGYIKNYVALQRLRLSDSENVKLLIRGDYVDKKIAPLLLITFIENAFKYGTDYKGRTKVDIKIIIQDNTLDFKVINLIGPKKTDKENSGIGLKNVKNRLGFQYPEAHCLRIMDNKDDYRVDLQLKLS
ncbi:sensor histidine kinase [Flavobacteriaceae bacterium TP-CH-4]|uniref:Sensor histidine kinase n=1 Tax=Pelagihabitans pacificus TaxID=2696054 RepID=A0A967EAM9_9FLAO|nr:sensor histidine kinase [Pelagihabitans pacificus]NHF59581.1 sensor histidine kinase [Pelagihabitans pacificus]